jgi:hypothetical protein
MARCGSVDCLLVEGEIGVQRDLGGLDMLVTHPQGDDAGIDAAWSSRIAAA